MTDQTVAVSLTADELQTLICAMAGNFPPKLSVHRMPALRKLAKADRSLRLAMTEEQAT